MRKWVISSKPKYYNVVGAFNTLKSINWKQGEKKFQIGDIVYIYVAEPLKAIKYKTEVIQINLATPTIDDSEFVIDGSKFDSEKHMELSLLKSFDDDLLSYQEITEKSIKGLKGIQGPRILTDELESFILEKIRDNDRKRIHSVENSLDQKLNEESDELIQSGSTENGEYTPEPKKKPEPKETSGSKIYPRDRKTAVNAMTRANHSCEVDENHPSFIRKNTNLNYTEPHHLIPMSYQDSFENSLDVEANIVALCSNCHNQIHYGADAEKLITKLFKKRQKELGLAGISISLRNLLSLY